MILQKTFDAEINSLFEDAPIGIMVANADGIIVQVSKHLEEMFGYSREELIGNPVEILVPDVNRTKHIEDRARYDKNPFARSMGGESRLLGMRKDGIEIPVEIALSAVNSSGGNLTVAYVTDDTSRRDLEALQSSRELQLSGQLRDREAEIDLVDQVANIFTSTLDIDQVFEEFASQLRHLVEFDHASIIVIDRDGCSLLVNQYLRSGTPGIEPEVALIFKGSQTELACRTGQTLIHEDLVVRPGFSTDGFLSKAGLRSMMLSPLVYNERPIGSILLASHKQSAFGSRERDIVERLAHQIAPAMANARLYEEAVSNTSQLECLLKLAEIMGQPTKYEEKVHQVLEQVVERSEVSSAHYRIFDTTSRELVLTASTGTPSGSENARPARLGEESLAFQAFQQGIPLVVNDYQNDPKANPLLVQMGEQSAVFLPILAGGRTSALVTVVSKVGGFFTPDRVRFLTAIGDGLGNLLEHGQLLDELQSTTQEMALVDEVAKIITSTLNVEQVYERFALEAKKLVDFDRATLLGVDHSANCLTLIGTSGMEISPLLPGRKLPILGIDLINNVESEERVFVEDLEPPFDSAVHSKLYEAGLRSLMVVPLIYNDQVTGAFAVLSKRLAAFGFREQRIMERLASQIAPAVENARLFQESQATAQEIQRLNEASNHILDSNPSALVVLKGVDREIVTVNRSFCENFKLEKESLEGRPLLQVLNWAALGEFFNALPSCAVETHNEIEYTNNRGFDRVFSISVAPLQGDKNSDGVGHILLVLTDVTEQRQQQLKMQEHSRLASVGELASGVAHEINNPLATIHGLSELLQIDDWPQQVSEDARKIQEASERAAKVVSNLLSFARKSEPMKMYADVNLVVARALELKEHDLKMADIQLETAYSNANLQTMLDQPQIMQVLLNLLTNAEQSLKSQPGPKEITIATRLARDMVCIGVSDNGPGISSEQINSVFDPFFTTKEIGAGTGLGLSICYGIIRDHQGVMWVESMPGQKTTFHVELPVIAKESTEVSEASVAENIAKTGIRILVVDDEPNIRDILTRILSVDGHEVKSAADGRMAWEILQQETFDHILLDVRMPGMDGQELFRLISGYSPETAKKVVFITGDTASHETKSFLDSTGNQILTKPFNIEAIRKLV